MPPPPGAHPPGTSNRCVLQAEKALHIAPPTGVKVNNAEALDKLGLDRKRLARLSVESYLQQILRHGFFQ